MVLMRRGSADLLSIAKIPVVTYIVTASLVHDKSSLISCELHVDLLALWGRSLGHPKLSQGCLLLCFLAFIIKYVQLDFSIMIFSTFFRTYKGKLHSIMLFSLGGLTLLKSYWTLGLTLHLSTLNSLPPCMMLQGLDFSRKYTLQYIGVIMKALKLKLS